MKRVGSPTVTYEVVDMLPMLREAGIRAAHSKTPEEWGEEFGFDVMTRFPYDPAKKLHMVGETEDGSPVTMGTEELIGSLTEEHVVVPLEGEDSGRLVGAAKAYIEAFFANPENSEWASSFDFEAS